MKKIKQFTSTILALIMLMSVFTSIPISAYAATSGTINGTVKWSISGTTLTFSGTGIARMYEDVPPWESQAKNIKKIIVCEGITDWDLSCFDIAPNVEEVQLPSTVITTGSFWYANSLKKLTVYARDAYVYSGIDTVSENTVLYGYSGSTLETYAFDYGRTFVDIETNKQTKYTRSNSELIKMLPTDLPCAEPASVAISLGERSTGKFLGYRPHIAHETDTNNENYKAIVAQTKEIIKNCKTNMEKTKALATWVAKYLRYTVGLGDSSISNIYITFEDRWANCEGYTYLLNYMLYIAGIPTATVATIGHMYSLALVDGKWYDIECTTGQINTNYDTRGVTINKIVYANPDLTVMLIENTRGITFAGPGWNDLEDDQFPDTLNIPDNADFFHYASVRNYPHDIANVVGNRGTAGETWCKNNLPCITYDKNKYYAHPNHNNIEKDYEPTYNDGGYIYSKCLTCGHEQKDYYEDKLEEDFFSLTAIKLDKTEVTYNGKIQSPKLIIKDKDGKTLDKKYYTVTCDKYLESCCFEPININNIKDVGKYKIEVEFKGKYLGYKEFEYIVRPKGTCVSSIKADYKGFTVNWNKQTTQTTGYQIQYATKSDFSNAATVYGGNSNTTSKKITGRAGNTKYYVRVRTYKKFEDTCVFSAWSDAKTVTTTNYPTNITLSSSSYTYDGKAKTPGVTVKDANGKKLSTKYYTVSYASGRKNVGSYKVTIKFKNGYSGTATRTFNIVPKSTTVSTVTAKAKGFTVKWNKQTNQTTGYQVQYATKSNFSNAATVYGGNSKTTSKTITGRAANTKYYVRVRTYKNINGTYYYSPWSSAKTVTTKR